MVVITYFLYSDIKAVWERLQNERDVNKSLLTCDAKQDSGGKRKLAILGLGRASFCVLYF